MGRRLLAQVKRDEVPTMAAALAYHFFLALFPFFIFLTVLGSFVAGMVGLENPADQAVDLLREHVPPEAAGVVGGELRSVVEARNPGLLSRNSGLLSIGLVAALWAASGGVRSIMKAMNHAHDIEESRSFWKRYLVSLAITVLAGTFLIVAFAGFVLGQVLGEQVAQALNLEGAYTTALGLAHWGLPPFLVLAGSVLLYWAAPNIALSLKRVLPGAALFTAGWIGATLLFAFWVNSFGEYNATYGTLASVAILLLWFFITGNILLLGAELNAVLYEMAHPVEVVRSRREKRGGASEAREGRRGRAPALWAGRGI
jgi:membrane protein